MSDNTVLNPGGAGDTIRTIQRTQPTPVTGTTTTAKTEVVNLCIGGDKFLNASGESLVTSENPLPVSDPTGLIQAQLIYQSLLIAQAAQIGGYVPLDANLAAMLGVQN